VVVMGDRVAGLCSECKEPLGRGNTEGTHQRCQPSFCTCTQPLPGMDKCCGRCLRPFYHYIADMPEVRAAVAERGWKWPR